MKRELRALIKETGIFLTLLLFPTVSEAMSYAQCHSLAVAQPVQATMKTTHTPFSKLSPEKMNSALKSLKSPPYVSVLSYPSEPTEEDLRAMFPNAVDIKKIPCDLQGKTNAKLLMLDVDDVLYLVRTSAKLFGSKAAFQENAIAEEMGKRGIAPFVHHSDPKNGILALSFIKSLQEVGFSGDHLQGIPNLDECLMKLLKRVHSTDKFTFKSTDGQSEIGTHTALDYVKMAYSIIEKGFLEREDQILLDRIVDTPSPSDGQDLVLIHGDPQQANFLYDGKKLYLIDWELSGLGHPYYDVAHFANSRANSFEEGIDLLSLYLGQIPSNSEIKQLQQFRCVDFGLFSAQALAFSYAMGKATGVDVKIPVDGERQLNSFEDVLHAMHDKDFDLIAPRNLYLVGIAVLRASNNPKYGTDYL